MRTEEPAALTPSLLTRARSQLNKSPKQVTTDSVGEEVTGPVAEDLLNQPGNKIDTMNSSTKIELAFQSKNDGQCNLSVQKSLFSSVINEIKKMGSGRSFSSSGPILLE